MTKDAERPLDEGKQPGHQEARQQRPDSRSPGFVEQVRVERRLLEEARAHLRGDRHGARGLEQRGDGPDRRARPVRLVRGFGHVLRAGPGARVGGQADRNHDNADDQTEYAQKSLNPSCVPLRPAPKPIA